MTLYPQNFSLPSCVRRAMPGDADHSRLLH